MKLHFFANSTQLLYIISPLALFIVSVYKKEIYLSCLCKTEKLTLF